MSRSWNPRYLEYCRAHGEASPERMLEKDRARWPGGCMAGFSIWIQAMWKEWYRTLGPCDGRNQACRIVGHAERLHQDHAAFDAWLARRPAEGAA